jgi:hypothetical protein
MKKIRWAGLVCLLVLLGAVLSSCQWNQSPNDVPTLAPTLKPTPDPADTSNLFRSEEYHFSYRIPVGWTFDSENQGAVSMCQDTQKIDGFASNFMVTASARDPELAAITEDDFQDAMRTHIKDYEVTEFSMDQNEQGETVMTLTGTYTSNRQSLVNKLTIYNKGDFCFSFGFTCSAQGWDRARQDYEYLLSSVGD